MAKINDFIEGSATDTRFLASLAANHEARLLESIRTLRENIIGMVNKLDSTPAGKLQGIKVNLKQSQKIHKQLVGQFEKDYNKKVNKMLGDFSHINRVISRRYKALNESIEFTGIDKVMMDSLKLSTYGRYVQFGEQARNSIASAMYNSVAGGAKMSTLVDTIKGILTGHRDARGRPMTMYAKGFAQDAIMNYHNQVNIKKGEDAGMTHFLYYGDIIGTSRQFCITRVGKVYNKRQILAWDRLNWQGKSGPPFAERGGYNCRHHWRPVRKEWLQNEDKEQISRNEILGEMSVPSNIKARNLSTKIESKVGLLKKLDEKEALLKEKALATPAAKKESFEALLINTQEKVALKKEIKTLRDKLAKIGGAVKPKKPVVVKPKVKKPVKKPKAPIVKPKPTGIPVGVEPLDAEAKKWVGKVKYYVKNGKTVGGKSKMFKAWDKMNAYHKQYYIDLWISEGIDVSKYYHLIPKKFPPITVPPFAPPVTPPIVKPKKPKVPPKAPKGPGKAPAGGTIVLPTDPNELLALGQNKIDELVEVIEYAQLAKAESFEAFLLNVQRQATLLEQIEGINTRLVAKGITPIPLPKRIKKVAKIIPPAPTQPAPVISITKPKVDELTTKLDKQGIQDIYDAGSTKFTDQEWMNKVLDPLSKEVDRLNEMSWILADSLENAPLRRLEIYKGKSLIEVGESGANGMYQGYNNKMWLASRTEDALKELEKKLVIGQQRWSVTDAAQSSISTFRHELGHHVQNVLDLNPTWDAMNMSQAWNDIWNAKGPSWFKQNVTVYSGYTNHEAFAESFAAYTSKFYTRGLLPRIVENYFDELFTGMRGNYSFVSNKVVAEGVKELGDKIARGGIFKSVRKPLTKSKLTKNNSYTRNKKGKWFFKGKPVSAAIEKKIKKIAVPPAWTDVLVSTDFKAETLAVGRDAVNKLQYRFSAKRTKGSAKKKYIRVKNFRKDMPGIRKKIEAGIKKGDPRAYVLELENKTAIRIGTDRDFKAKVKAYGLTTLQNEHVVIKGNRIILDFTAKKGTHAHYELVDERLARFLKARKAKTVKGQKLFPDVTANKLNAYLKELARGKKYTIKDFRTYHATRIALDELEGYTGQILTAKEKKSIVKEVSEIVSRFLSNTPAMAKNSYIDPMVWETIGGI